MKSQILMTRLKYEQLLSQLNKLKKVDFPHNRKNMREVMESGGGMHDNAAYELALQDERLLLQRIRELESVINSAQIITPPNSNEKVKIGHRVKARNVNTGALYEIVICGYMDTTLDINWVSYQAPLAACFISKRVGDEVKFLSPAGEIKIWKILKIEIIDFEKERDLR